MARSSQNSLKSQIPHALNETLILITGDEILIGFQYTAVFNKSFAQFPSFVQDLQLVGLVLLLLALILVMSPVPFDRIAERGLASRRLCHFVRWAILAALLPFSLGLAIDVYVIAQKIGGQTLGLIAAIVVGLTAIGFWYVLEFVRRSMKGYGRMNTNQGDEDHVEHVELSEKIEHVLGEVRVVLPGAQALLGFQFISVLSEGFDTLSQTSKYLHLFSLGLIAFSTILLMTPAAYHRIVDEGEDTEHFHRLAGAFILAAMIVLALGIIINFYIVVDRVTASLPLAISSAGIMLLVFYGFWFGYTWYRRRTRKPAQK